MLIPDERFTLYLATLERAHQLGNDTEHTHRSTLKILLEKLAPGVTATNEPKRVRVGAPDYVLTRPTNYGAITLGYVEAKDLGARLEEIERDSELAQPRTRGGDQLKRYRGALTNLLFTDYIDFRWYTDGSLRQTARLATIGPGRTLVKAKDGIEDVGRILDNFLRHQPEQITRPQELALRMARLTHIIRDLIIAAFDEDQASNLLKGWRQAFAQVLLADLDQPENTPQFADMFSQTLAYGLFSARIMDQTPETFTRQEAQRLIPLTNPFLRRFFAQISGIEMDDEPYAGFVDDLAALLAHTDMQAVLADFGRRTRQEDPVVHFYETFLAAYDPKLREQRGVYFTPLPVVSYIVRSVDHLLKTTFNLRDGLADTSKVTVANTDRSLRNKDNTIRKQVQIHRVLILDPATGTATFPYAVIDLIRNQFKAKGNAGMWSDYVREHLLPRLFAFELLMAPYAVAHFKLGLQLAGRDLPEEEREVWTYDFATGERLGVYLTNTLDEAHEHTGLPLFTQWVADETDQANRVKRDLPIMVVMGNPPYSGESANKGAWISGLLKGRDTQTGERTANYFEVDGAPLGERNPKWLNDDYVKFIRFAQWRIEQSGSGILAYISNNGYINNPTFRGMRQALMQTFTDIYILNLHGSTKKKERSPDGSPDENVFDIQQGVCIALFVKEAGKTGSAMVRHADLWGVRETSDGMLGKYPWLAAHSVADTEWSTLTPQSPYYLFVPQATDVRTEYEQERKVTEIFERSSEGFKTHRDAFAVAFTEAEARQRLDEFLSTEANDMIAQRFKLADTGTWLIANARKMLREDNDPLNIIHPCLYRPFDRRVSLLHSAIMDRPRLQTQEQLIKPNFGLATTRAVEIQRGFEHVLCTILPMDHHAVSMKESNYLFLLYHYPEPGKPSLFDTEERSTAPGGRRPNLNPQFIEGLSKRVGLSFVPDGRGDLQTTFGPEDVFNYIYAVLHSPTYRGRYADFLKTDFPRIPLTSDPDLFRKLCAIGSELVALHTMEAAPSAITSYPERGDNRVVKVEHKPQTDTTPGRIYINKTQYFENVPQEVWDFEIGGYQVADKWLKDRKNRVLTYSDLTHYGSVLAILAETIRLMTEIDDAIPDWPLQ